MGVSRITALTIQSNKVRIEAGGPDSNGKFMGWIMLDVDRWHPLLNSEPIYDSAEQARADMQRIVNEIRAANIENPLDTMPEGSIIKEIVAAAKKE